MQFPETLLTKEDISKIENGKIQSFVDAFLKRTHEYPNCGISPVSQLLYDLFYFTICDNSIKRSETVKVLLHSQLSKLQDHNKSLLDTIWMFDQMTSVLSKTNKTQKETFCSLVRSLVDLCPSIVPNLISLLKLPTLEKLGLLMESDSRKKVIREKTAIKYKQNKFNLFIEESEGFAKVIVMLTYPNLFEIQPIQKIHEQLLK
ncbi:tho2 protein [Anaeramoeba flamelloides]|uniref:Tho2 protein n=1 Tax=Anaeramoeba flamelloides TaxID=1746091 RepID=A0AAV7Z229_9EUKA|nr:tho2 protein [Anaeramoeba flamelloides]